MEMSLAQVAETLGGSLTDDSRADVLVSNVAPLAEAGPGDLAFFWAARYREDAERSQAEAIVCGEAIADRPCIVVQDPESAMLTLLGAVYQQQHPPLHSRHPSSVISDQASVADDVAVGAHAVVEAGATIGAGTQLFAGAYVGRGVEIGNDCTIHPNATVLDQCRLGNRVTIWSGAVVGKDGFGFVQRGGQHHRIPQVGSVVIEDDVEIGALSTVARGAIGDTVIRQGVVIDDHCHIAHGCEIGEYTLIVGRTAMGGSVKIGRNCFLLQDSGISTGLTVGDGAMLGSCARVFYKDVPAGARLGFVANTHDHLTAKRIEASLPKLPEMRRRLRQVERRIEALSKSD